MRPPAAGLLALLLAACNAQDGGNGSRTGAAGVSLRPGMWETTFRILSVDLPTAPAEIVDTLRAGISMAPVTERACLSPAEAADWSRELRDRAMRGQTGYDCQPGENVFAGGRVRMTLNCRSTSPGQPDLRQAMVGSYTTDTLQIALTGATATPATDLMPAYPVHIESTLTGRRTGDCPAGARN
jgi:hypothetical protein